MQWTIHTAVGTGYEVQVNPLNDEDGPSVLQQPDLRILLDHKVCPGLIIAAQTAVEHVTERVTERCGALERHKSTSDENGTWRLRSRFTTNSMK